MIIIIDYKTGDEIKIEESSKDKEEENLSSVILEIQKDKELNKQVINIHGEIVII